MREITRLRELLDTDRRSLRLAKEMKERATYEHEKRMRSLDADILGLEETIRTWKIMIQKLGGLNESEISH